MGELIVIGDHNWEEHHPANTHFSGGLMERNYAAVPVGSSWAAPAFDLKLIPRNEWKSRLADQIAAKAQLTDIRDRGYQGRRILSRNQDGYGYCWAHSTVSAVMAARARDNQPFLDLSPFMVAAIIKRFRNQGGWGLESVEFMAEHGCATSATWPQQAMERSLAAESNKAMWADAARSKITTFMDLHTRDPQFIDQFVTCLLLNMPVVSDFNWWGHSVCTLRLVQIDPADIVGSIQTDIWNSWWTSWTWGQGQEWSEDGIGRLQGRRAIPNGAVGVGYTAAAA